MRFEPYGSQFPFLHVSGRAVVSAGLWGNWEPQYKEGRSIRPCSPLYRGASTLWWRVVKGLAALGKGYGRLGGVFQTRAQEPGHRRRGPDKDARSDWHIGCARLHQ